MGRMSTTGGTRQQGRNSQEAPDARLVKLRRAGGVPLAHEVRVLAVWHAQRDAGPPLRPC
jgi:hypothetical protein